MNDGVRVVTGLASIAEVRLRIHQPVRASQTVVMDRHDQRDMVAYGCKMHGRTEGWIEIVDMDEIWFEPSHELLDVMLALRGQDHPNGRTKSRPEIRVPGPDQCYVVTRSEQVDLL